MPFSSVLLLTLTYLMLSSPSAGDQYVEVDYTCPSSTTTVDINWDNEIQAQYSGTDGKSGTIDFKLASAPNRVSFQFERASHLGGQKIGCQYRSNSPFVIASYAYSISREVISCAPSGSQRIRCRLKP